MTYQIITVLVMILGLIHIVQHLVVGYQASLGESKLEKSLDALNHVFDEVASFGLWIVGMGAFIFIVMLMLRTAFGI